MQPWTTYKTVDLLDYPPHRDERTPETGALGFDVLDNRTGLRTLDVRASTPQGVQELVWAGLDLGAVYELKRFVAARRGRLKPFWLPTWRRDLELSADAASGAGAIVVKACGYAARYYPGSNARRHLWLRSPAGTVLARKVTAAVDNGNGTETLTVVGPAGEATLGQSVTTEWAVMFLRYVRLEADTVEIRWRGPLAIATLRARELPKECPA